MLTSKLPNCVIAQQKHADFIPNLQFVNISCAALAHHPKTERFSAQFIVHSCHRCHYFNPYNWSEHWRHICNFQHSPSNDVISIIKFCENWFRITCSFFTQNPSMINDCWLKIWTTLEMYDAWSNPFNEMFQTKHKFRMSHFNFRFYQSFWPIININAEKKYSELVCL